MAVRRFAKVLAEIESRLRAGDNYDFETRVAAYRKALRVEEKWLELQHRRVTGGIEVGQMRADTIDDFTCHILDAAVAELRTREG